MRFLSFVLAAVCFLLALSWSLRSQFVNPYPVVCDLVAAKIYLPDEEVRPWKELCLKRSRLVHPWTSHEKIFKDVSYVLQTLKVSHLEVFEPAESKLLWKGVSKETGIESEFVDGELVIFKIHPGSAAETAGLKYGDIIVSLNGEHPNPWQVQGSGGKLVYRRGKIEKEISLGLRELQREEKVSVKKISAKAWQIQIPSFRKDFFLKNPLLPFAAELSQAKMILIDLRGNQGGNFVAGLRFLANFICEEKTVGRLEKPKDQSGRQAVIPDDLNDLGQLEALDKVQTLFLKTKKSPLCLRAPLKILVDAKTASVAEMVAQALKEERGAKILGAPSSGQLLVGVWYPLDELGAGVQISIPEALYKSAKGHSIEGKGVELDQEIYYNLNEMQKGEDSWVKRALFHPRNKV